MYINEPFIALPRRLLKIDTISMTSKVLYSLIYSSSANEGILTNTYLSNQLNLSPRQITRYIKELVDNGFIEVKDDRKNNRRIITPKFTFEVSVYKSASDIPDNAISDQLQGQFEDMESKDNINYVNKFGRFGNVKLSNGQYAVLKGTYGADRVSHYIDVLDEKIECDGLNRPHKPYNYLDKLLSTGAYDTVHLQYDKLLDDEDDNGGFTEL